MTKISRLLANSARHVYINMILMLLSKRIYFCDRSNYLRTTRKKKNLLANDLIGIGRISSIQKKKLPQGR